ncbi:S8 family peptidase [Mycobacterium canetti]|uniref:S8 family peptidase n=2 Tax=Mycobacterium canetti TaxID=78331 RepID=UPI001E406F50|nr:S8 family peptidase [Mycobacterium canetti]
MRSTLESSDEARSELHTDEELRALGTIITLEGEDPAYPLKIDSLQQFTRHIKSPRRPKWLLLSVLPADPDAGVSERATVWVSDAYRPHFLQLFENYLEKTSSSGKPRNNELVANIARIRSTVLQDLWQSDGEPTRGTTSWWEIWLRRSGNGPDLLRRFAQTPNLGVSSHMLRLVDRDVMWIEATWEQLEVLPFTAVPVAEIRRPEFIDSIEDLSAEEQAEYADDLAQRLEPADEHQPAVCHLDTGVARTHILIEGSLAPHDLQTVVGTSGFDRDGHGTKMAGVALFGDLDQHLIGSDQVVLRHRLESVRILPTRSEPPHEPRTYGDVTAQAVSLPEVTSALRRRVFCLPVTTNSDTPEKPGQPTLWSATIDALAVGTSVVRNGEELQLLSPPNPDAARLIVVSAGNVDHFVVQHLEESDTSPVRDPGQAWNALTVGACTEMINPPTDPTYVGWTTVAEGGELSPHSRTSLPFGPRPWPIKPDIVLEGGNVLHDGASLFEPNHAALSLRSTGHTNDQALASANATSAATAQASRLAALAMAAYPGYWPETIRALLVHGAEWTPAMRTALDAARKRNLQAQQMMLRRYGWGVPTEDRVLYSSGQAVTLVVQDEFVPFEGDEFKVPAFRLHDLPWPREVLQDLGDALVTLRVTLSYFIEPTASRRGWRQRYKYPSHSLRFELQDPLESEMHFVQRVNRDAGTEEAGGRPAPGRVKWVVGANQRNLGSLHQDIWETSGIELAESGKLAVYPVGGWWKNNRRRDRIDKAVRYALVVSLRTVEAGVDLYTPVANLLHIPTAVTVD